MRLNVYKIVGYRGPSHGFNGQRDYNFKEIVAFPANLSKQELRKRLDKIAASKRSGECYAYSYYLIGVVKLDAEA